MRKNTYVLGCYLSRPFPKLESKCCQWLSVLRVTLAGEISDVLMSMCSLWDLEILLLNRCRSAPSGSATSEHRQVKFAGTALCVQVQEQAEWIGPGCFTRSTSQKWTVPYRVTRIPYFIQLTPLTVKRLFGIELEVDLYDESVPSVGPKGRNTPAFLCPAGISRMAFEFAQHPEQYRVNLTALKQVPEADRLLVGTAALEDEYTRLMESRADLSLRFFDEELTRL